MGAVMGNKESTLPSLITFYIKFTPSRLILTLYFHINSEVIIPTLILSSYGIVS